MTHLVSKSFKSIGDFIQYLNETPTNKVFANHTLDSKQGNYSFTKTYSFEEAIDLMKNGWDDIAKKLEKSISLTNKELATKEAKRMQYDVTGFQASVPRYLQGIPTNMINKKNVVQKQKVITIVKHIGYLGHVSTNEIIENSIKALQIVRAIEARGIRVNLDVISPAEVTGEIILCRIRIKSAGERLNVSKVAFPLVHPSMLRRLIFRFRETHPDVTKYDWTGGYGRSMQDRMEIKKYLNKDDYYLHNFIENVDDEIKLMKI